MLEALLSILSPLERYAKHEDPVAMVEAPLGRLSGVMSFDDRAELVGEGRAVCESDFAG